MDLVFFLVMIQGFSAVCSGLRYFKECNGDKKEVLIKKGDVLDLLNGSRQTIGVSHNSFDLNLITILQQYDVCLFLKIF